MKKIVGQLNAQNLKIALIFSKWNNVVGHHLVHGAKELFVRLNGNKDNLTLVIVPGSFEIPLATKQACETQNYDAIVTLGVLIRGDTPHFEYIANQVTKSLGNLSLEYDIPISYGILTVNDMQQAIDRAGGKISNKGEEAMYSAIEMANLKREMQS